MCVYYSDTALCRPFDATRGLTTIVCPEELISETAFVVTLLYRPGHYDILYVNSST